MTTQTIPTIKLDDFFKNEYIAFSVYDNVRKIGSFIDGQKNVNRKILHTIMQTNVDKFTKVSNLGPRIQDYTQYLHGSLEQSVVKMTQSYPGCGNNIQLLEGDGNFGSAFIPEAAATRYIFSRMSPNLKKIFNRDDYVNLPSQNFEGSPIEPRYYVPVLPLIAINGSEGVSIGFAQRILPRNPKEIKKWVVDKSQGKKPDVDLTPYWNGINAKIIQGDEPHKWVSLGNYYKKTSRRIVIDRIPVFYTLSGYIKILDKLVDDKKIRSYEDLSDNDVFLFEIRVDAEFMDQEHDEIMTLLKLKKKITENYTCIDGDNKIRPFSSMEEILEEWYDVRITYNKYRKASILKKLSDSRDHAARRASFIKGVVSGDIELKNNKENVIVQQATKYDSSLDGYVDEFLKLPMRTLTSEEIQKQIEKVKKLEEEINEYEKLSYEDILTSDIDNIGI